jgi:uncharacterized membrane protein
MGSHPDDIRTPIRAFIMHSIAKALLHVLTFGVAAYVVLAYGFMPLGALVHPDMKAAFLTHATGIYLHAFAAVVALVLGPFQFSANIRQQRPVVHRWSGRLYLTVGVLVGGLAGLYLSRHAFGGPVAQLGFALLAGLWLFTGLRAYLAARRGAFEAHRKWMVRNFSLTLAAVTLRIYLPLSMVLGVEFARAYPIIAWLCWVPNIVLAEWRYNSRDSSKFPFK